MEDKTVPDWKEVDPNDSAFDYYKEDHERPICVTCEYLIGGIFCPCSVCIHKPEMEEIEALEEEFVESQFKEQDGN